MEQTTELFIDLLRKRNRAACQRLVGDYGPAVFQLVRRIVVRQEDAEEVYQDVFGRQPDIVYMDEQDLGFNNLVDIPEDNANDSHTVQALEEALASLPPHEQAIITMFYYDNMSLADIAYVTGSIPSTVGSQLCRIRKKLYKMIKAMHP